VGGVLATLLAHESCNRLHRVSPTAFLCSKIIIRWYAFVRSKYKLVCVATITVGGVMYNASVLIVLHKAKSAKCPLPYVVKNQCIQAFVIN